jgi:cytochrome c2
MEESQWQVIGITQNTVVPSTASVEQAEYASCIVLWANNGVVHWHEKKLENFLEEGPLKVT